MSQTQHEPGTLAESTPTSSNSRHSSPVEPDQGVERSAVDELSSSPQTPHHSSSTSEGYPSWLPKRPPPPAPRSTVHSGMLEAGPSDEHYVIGRKATPRSVRIMSMAGPTQDPKEQARQPTDPSSRMFSGAHARVWSRATSAGLTPTVFSATFPQLPKPRFRSSALHLELLRSPSWKMRIWFFLFPLWVFFHLPLQTFFDFNAVFILLLVAKHPNPAAPGVPGSGRNWALGAAAYIACWVTQVFVVFIVYEVIYSFIRRWRVKRPLMLPIYLSSPAFNLVSMTSYTNFCFMYHIRLSAFSSEHGSFRDGLAETFYYYSQNTPTVALLLPRAGLSLALLLAYWSPQAGELALADAGIRSRDGTFFRSSDQTLTNYARGVLIANAAWTAWRLLVLFVSWIGLWVLSGQGCAGLCGPRYRWEEDDAEKTVAAFSDNLSDAADSLPWTWREGSLIRVLEAYFFCLTNKAPKVNEKKDGSPSDSRANSMPIEGMDRVFAAIGLGGPQPSRRGVLSEDLFDSPDPDDRAEVVVENVQVPPAAALAHVTQSREKQGAGPSTAVEPLPYPFVGSKAQISSEDVVPFPPSPNPEADENGDSPHTEEEGEGEEEQDEESPEVEESEVLSEEGRRTSESMSSLGHPIVSRYPFQYRRPARGGSVSSATHSHLHSGQTYSTPSRSTQSRSTRYSHSTSTGNRESSDSPYANSSDAPSPLSHIGGNAIPMPPRHPQRRTRAGTVPHPMVPSSPGSPSSPTPIVFPGRSRARPRVESSRTRTESTASIPHGPVPIPFSFDSDEETHESLMEVPEAEGSSEEAEQHDSVGLLSTSTSPRASRTSLVNMRHLGGRRRSNGSRSHSGPGSRTNSRSRTNSSSSRSEAIRSRAQSLIQSIGAASQSSLELVRSRANSMARLSDSPYYSTSPDPMPSSPENHTFGHPLVGRTRDESLPPSDNHDSSDAAESLSPSSGSSRSRTDSSNVSVVGEESTIARAIARQRLTSEASRFAPSERRSEGSVQTERGPASPSSPIPPMPPMPSTTTPDTPRPTVPIPIPGRAPGLQPQESMADMISTAHQSFVTAPATVQGTTDSGGRTPSSWGTSAMDKLAQAQGGTWKPA